MSSITEVSFPKRKKGRFDDLCVDLKRMAHELGPGAKMPTIIQLQELFDVSIGTLDRGLGMLEQQHIIHRIHGKGIFVSTSLMRHVCFICDPSFFRGAGASPFWSILLERAYEQSTNRKQAFSLHFVTTYGGSGLPLHAGVVEEIVAGNVHGILAVGLSKTALNWIEDLGIPVVGFACDGSWIVELDMGTMIQEGVASLAAGGCRHIGLWKTVAPFRPGDFWKRERPLHPDNDPGWSEDYLFGEFLDALGKFGLAFDPQLTPMTAELLVTDAGHVTLTHQEQGYFIAERIFGAVDGPRPDGVVIADDLMAQGALTAFHNLGIRVPGDVKVASHSNVGSMTLLGYENALTRIEFDPEEVALAMFSILDPLLAREEVKPRKILLKPKVRQ